MTRKLLHSQRVSRFTWLFLVTTIISLGSMSCSVMTDHPEVALPEQAYSRELPAGANEVTNDGLEEGIATKGWRIVSQKTLQDQRQAASAVEEADDQTIASFKQDHPTLNLTYLNPPDPDRDAAITALSDGNFEHTIRLSGGQTRTVVTMGHHFIKRLFVRALNEFPTRENQYKLYRSAYDKLPADWKAALDLVSPEVIYSDPNTYTADVIKDLNKKIDEKIYDIIDSIEQMTILPEGYTSDSTHEIGYLNGSDRVGSNDTSPNCRFQATGIRNNYDWPLKYYVTSIKDQAGRGTCVSFANSSAVETQVALKHAQWVNLSEQIFYHRMKTVWRQEDFGDGFNADFAFAEMEREAWLLPFENQWGYNPSLQRFTGIGYCIRKNCEDDDPDFQTCENQCATQFAMGTPNYDDCIQVQCRDNSASFQSCKTICEDEPRNYRYYDSCLNYPDSCSDSTHQSELVCAGTGSNQAGMYYSCAYILPEKNSNSSGYRITTSAQVWDVNDPDTSFARVLLALFLKNSVVIGLPVTAAFDDASDDGFMAYVANDTNHGGHGMHAVGYIDNDELATILPNAPQGDGGGYLIVKNSWSNCWGDGGYLYMPYRTAKEYIGDATILYGVQ